jgi:hypothetical protein
MSEQTADELWIDERHRKEMARVAAEVLPLLTREYVDGRLRGLTVAQAASASGLAENTARLLECEQYVHRLLKRHRIKR